MLQTEQHAGRCMGVRGLEIKESACSSAYLDFGLPLQQWVGGKDGGESRDSRMGGQAERPGV